MTFFDFFRGFGFCGVFVRCENLFSARYALVYALIRVLLRYISDEQEKKHTAEEILDTLRDMLKSCLGK